MSQIFEALTIARDRAIEDLVERRTRSNDALEPVSKGLVLTHRRIRNTLILAFFGTALVLLVTNYAFSPSGVVAKGQPIYGVAFPGTIHPASEFFITADLGGTVSTISVNVGDAVTRGQPLLRMDNHEAALALQQAGAELQAAQSNFDQFREPLAEADARVAVSQRQEQQVPTRQWRDSPERAGAAYDLALNNYNRAKALYDAGLVPKQELDIRVTELRIAQDDLDNANKLAGASSRLEHDQTIQANLQAMATREELREQLRQAQLKYQRAKELAESNIVRATKAGVVSEVPVHLGDRVSSGTVLVRLAELDRMVAEVPVAASMIAQLNVGQPARVELPSLPPRQVEGRVRVINPLPSPNMTHVVEVEFDNPTLSVLAGQSAEVRFSKP